MSWRRTLRTGLVILVAAYAGATWWVFTRSTPVVSDRPVTIRLAHWQIEKGPADGFAAVIRRYEELHPRVKVEQEGVPGPVYRQWVRSNLTGGTATDLLEFAYFLQGMNDVPARYFEPLTALMNEPNPYNRGTPLAGVPWRLTFADGLYGMLSQSPEIGQIYGATLSQGSCRFFCNRTLLEQIAGPAATAPRTFVDFRRLWTQTAEYSRRLGRVIHPLAGSLSNARWLTEMLLAGCTTKLNLELDRDGLLSRTPTQSMEDYLQGRWSFRRPELRAALALVREVDRQMRPGFAQLSRDNAVQEFLRGEALFIYSGTYDAVSLKTLASFPIEVMRVPQLTADDPVVGPYFEGPFGDGLMTTGVEMYLNKNSPHKAEALDFLRFLTSYEGGRLFMVHSGWLTSIRDVPAPPDLEVYRAVPVGYTTGAFYEGGAGPSATPRFEQNLDLLVGPDGSVDRFVDALEHNLREETVADLRRDVHDRLAGTRGADAEIAAMSALNRLGPPETERTARRDTLATNQTQAELKIYESIWVLGHSGAQP